MNCPIGLLAAITAVVLSAGTAQAQNAPLTREALAGCAAQVLQLRQDSALQTGRAAQLDAQRIALNQRSDALAAEDVRLQPDNLKAGLDLHQRRLQNQQQATALNAQVAQLRVDIDGLNRLRRDYDQRCSQRPYRRADLDALPEAARSAMRAGLGDVQVPYLSPDAR